MKYFVKLFMFIFLLGIASTSQATTITAPILNNPASTDNLWAYSFSDSGSGDAYSFWYTSYASLPNATLQGYVTGDHGNWADSFMGSNFDRSDTTSTHIFETYIMSSIDQTVRISSGGDDGNSIFVDEQFETGAGFSVPIYTDFLMTSGTQYKISLVVNNAGGGWHSNFALGLLGENGDYTGALFADAANISMNATGEFTTSPVPEPATMLLFGTGLIGLVGVARRKKK